MIDCAKPLIPFGVAAETISFQTIPTAEAKARLLFQNDFNLLRGLTKFPMGLLIAQHFTEYRLSKFLMDRGARAPENEVAFLRGVKATSIKESIRDTSEGRKNGFLVDFDDGRIIWCQYLVGADGSRSIVGDFEKLRK